MTTNTTTSTITTPTATTTNTTVDFNNIYTNLEYNRKIKFKTNNYNDLFKHAKTVNEKTSAINLLNQKLIAEVISRGRYGLITQLFLCVFDCLGLTQVGRAKSLLSKEVNNLFMEVNKFESNQEMVKDLADKLHDNLIHYSFSKAIRNKELCSLLEQPPMALKLNNLGVKPINFSALLKTQDINSYIKSKDGHYNVDNLMKIKTTWNGTKVSLFQLLVLEKQFILINDILTELDKDKKDKEIALLLSQKLKIDKKKHTYTMALIEEIGVNAQETSLFAVTEKTKNETKSGILYLIDHGDHTPQFLSELSLCIDWHNRIFSKDKLLCTPLYTFNRDAFAGVIGREEINDYLDKLTYQIPSAENPS